MTGQTGAPHECDAMPLTGRSIVDSSMLVASSYTNILFKPDLFVDYMGIVEDAILLGAPVTGNSEQWAKFGRVVAGRLVNGYCK